MRYVITARSSGIYSSFKRNINIIHCIWKGAIISVAQKILIINQPTSLESKTYLRSQELKEKKKVTTSIKNINRNYVASITCVLTLGVPQTVGHQAPWSCPRNSLSLQFSNQGISPPGNQTQVFCTAVRFFTIWATKIVNWQKAWRKITTRLRLSGFVKYY